MAGERLEYHAHGIGDGGGGSGDSNHKGERIINGHSVGKREAQHATENVTCWRGSAWHRTARDKQIRVRVCDESGYHLIP
uniref:Uncharacterized protein n=1 Tax=Oryza rufipogon TaxID=4529 RepID=A0A0E0Q6G1_ORYRU